MPATWELAVGARRRASSPRTRSRSPGKIAEDVPIEAGDVGRRRCPICPTCCRAGRRSATCPAAGDATVGRAAPDDPAGRRRRLHDPRRHQSASRLGDAGLVQRRPTTGSRRTGFRLALAEPAGRRGDAAPEWDPATRAADGVPAKGQTAVVPLSSYMTPDDLKLMGQWQWLREFVDLAPSSARSPAHLLPGQPVDLIAHVLQRAVEGGHWMLNPPTLLTLVHAVQQPIGRPAFAALNVDHSDRDRRRHAADRSPARPHRSAGADADHGVAAASTRPTPT